VETLAQSLAQGLLARWAQALRLRCFLLNYSKFIHLCDRYLVYSLTTPALFSPSAAHFIACTFYGGIQNRNLHNLLSLAITDGCNARCDYCSLPELRRLIGDAQQLGVSILNLVGGEFLLRYGCGRVAEQGCKPRARADGWQHLGPLPLSPGGPARLPRAVALTLQPLRRSEVSPRRAPRPAPPARRESAPRGGACSRSPGARPSRRPPQGLPCPDGPALVQMTRPLSR